MQTEEERAAAVQALDADPAKKPQPGQDADAVHSIDPAVAQSAEVAQALKAKKEPAAQSAKGSAPADAPKAAVPKKKAAQPPQAAVATQAPDAASADANPKAAAPPQAGAPAKANTSAKGDAPPKGADAAKEANPGKSAVPPQRADAAKAAVPAKEANPVKAAEPGKAGDPAAPGDPAKAAEEENAAKAAEPGKAPEGEAPPEGAHATKEGDAPAAPGAPVQADGQKVPQGGGQEVKLPAGDPVGAAPAPAPAPNADAKGPVDWDSEVAWHDYFQQFKGAPAGAGPGAAPAPAQPDRGQMVLDALGKGAKEGVKEGAAQFALETVLNIAASKIPMGASVLESGRMLTTLIQGGPSGWLEANVTGENAIVGKWGAAFQKFKGGGVVDVIEGVVNLLEGASSFIGTLTSILWIVAGAGFLISLFCPALLPFVVMATQWATTLGKINTVIEVFTTLLRLVVMAGRSMEILYSDASPDELLAKQKSLEGQTKSFTKESTNRALKSGREHVQNKAKAARNAPAKTDAPKADAPAAPKEKPALGSRILNVLGMAAGDFRPADNKGRAGLGRDVAEAGAEVRRNNEVTKAAFGKGDTAHKLNEMEQSGAVVFLGQKHEDSVDASLNGGGKRGTVRGEEKRAQATLAAKQKVAADAEAHANAQRQKLAAAADARRDAEEKLLAARASGRPAVAEAEAVVNQRRGALVGTEADLRRQQAQLQDEHDVLTQARYLQEHDRAGAKSGQYDEIVASTQARVDALHSGIQTTEKRVGALRQEVQEAELTLAQRKAALLASETEAQTASQAEQAAAAKVGTAAVTEKDAKSAAAAETGHAPVHEGESVKHAEAAWKQQQKQAAEFSAMLGWDGKGPTRLHGTNGTAGKAGRDILDAKHGAGKKTAVGAIESVVDGVEGVGQALSGGKDKPATPPGQAPGAAGPQANASPIAAQVRARLAQLSQELPAPPLQARTDAEQAKHSLSALDQEEDDLRNKRLSLAAVKAHGQTESGALKSLTAGAQAGQVAAGGQAKAAAALTAKQDAASQKVAETGAKSSEAGPKGAEASGLMSPIVGGMLKLMGMIPTKISSKGAQGAAATQNLATGIKDQGKATEQSGAMTKTATSDMAQMKSETASAGGSAGTMAQELAASEQQLAAKQVETDQVVAEVGEADLLGAERLKAVATERQQLQQMQTGALARADEWVQAHAGTRTKGMAEVEALAAQAGAKA